ncbi:MAG: hypothetical protein GY917_06515 [Planctomycetaceae bacterium]|jgi:hypothetical protein|nr:hypothetical protein [Planctomycetaceae bacterium]MCP4811640.1 hypothetical protein [Planctomycetaceae bacterium]MEC9002378.1 hypothetical protein [Planctomycetota bacterium]
MAKYYIESGQLKRIIEASGPISAAAIALERAREQDLELARVLTINERGFVRERPHTERYTTDLVLETGTLLTLLWEQALE